MTPTLHTGDYVICINIKPRSIRPGFIYIINHSDLGRIIKRVKPYVTEAPHTDYSDVYILSGDNPNSTPTTVMAPVKAERIVKRALFAITKSGLKWLKPESV